MSRMVLNFRFKATQLTVFECTRKAGWTLVLLAACGIWTAPAVARERIVKGDVNHDGRIDQLAHYNAGGRLTLLEVDSDADGRMDRFQHYRNGQLVSIEADTDRDGSIDTRDLYDAGRRSRQDQVDAEGRIVQTAFFNDREQPVRIERDTTAKGRFDTIYHFKDGRLTSSESDRDGDGNPDDKASFQEGKPLRRQMDTDGDGRFDQITEYDAQGLPAASRHDANGDGRWEIHQTYTKGVIQTQQVDENNDGRFDRLIVYQNGVPCEQRLDTNGDQRMDVITQYRSSAWQPNEPGQRILQTQDRNGDGRPDIQIIFDEAGGRRLVKLDTDSNGQTDTWQYYEDDRLVRQEVDRDTDGTADVIILYRDGKCYQQRIDTNGDGTFEIDQWFDRPGWSMLDNDR
jgi:antitoxin component YwqK of YwqJK toxin-antitoxin module